MLTHPNITTYTHHGSCTYSHYELLNLDYPYLELSKKDT